MSRQRKQNIIINTIGDNIIMKISQFYKDCSILQFNIIANIKYKVLKKCNEDPILAMILIASKESA